MNDRAIDEKNRRVVRILLLIMGALALAGLFAGIRW